MSLADHIHTQTPVRTGGLKCFTCVWIGTLAPKDLADFRDGVAAVQDETMQGSALWRACKEYGFPHTLSAFHNHLRRCES